MNERVAHTLSRPSHIAEHVILLVLKDQRRRIHAVELALSLAQNHHLVLSSYCDQVLSDVIESGVLSLTAPARSVEHAHLRRYVKIGRILRKVRRLEELRSLEQGENTRCDTEEEMRQENAMVGNKLIAAFTLQRNGEQTLRLFITRSLHRHMRRFWRLQSDQIRLRERRRQVVDDLPSGYLIPEEQGAQRVHSMPQPTPRRLRGQIALCREPDPAPNDVLDLALLRH